VAQVKAVTFQDIGSVTVSDVPEPELQTDDDVIVRVTRCAICGSDLHLLHGDIPMLPGDTCGHEYTGVIEAAGSGVRGFKTGDRVVGTFHTACGRCTACRRGEYHLCITAGVLGYGPVFGGLNGTQAEYARIPVADVNLRAIPENVSDEAALFCGDILTTAYGAVKNAHLEPGETVAVIGCGPVGIMAIQSAFAQGAGHVIAVDLVPERVALAESLGAIGINSRDSNPVRRVLEITDGDGADVVIEAVGGTKTILLAFELVRPGGRISAVGVSTQDTLEYPLRDSLSKDVSFRVGLANIHRDIDTTLKLVSSGRIDPTIVVSHRLGLSDAAEGYALFDKREASKVILEPGS
jgi:threonine dehydrogenase-like Zn-dependent dehydrogenase